MSVLIPDKGYVYNGLLRYNYLPMVKENLDEIAPVFSTYEFTPEVADIFVQRGEFRREGYDQIEYRVTRFNNVTRLMHVPHPFPYAWLCKHISENWNNLKHICDNTESQIKPARHNDDRLVILGEYELLESGRVVIMQKDRFPDTIMSKLEISTGNRYKVTADIASCFPSIYTHSIPWALIGHEESKSELHDWKNNRDNWYNKLDALQ